MVGFRLSLCQAAPPTRNDRIEKHTGVCFNLFPVPAARCAWWERVLAAGWPSAFLTGPDLRVSMPLLAKDPGRNESAWGCSAVGSAREWHSRGRRFNPGQLHQIAVGGEV